MQGAGTGVAGKVVAEAHRLGFDLVGIAPATAPATADRYRAWLEQGYQGEMGYLARPDAVAKRSDLARILPGVRSVVVVGANYYTVRLPPGLEDDAIHGRHANKTVNNGFADGHITREKADNLLVEKTGETYRNKFPLWQPK